MTARLTFCCAAFLAILVAPGTGWARLVSFYTTAEYLPSSMSTLVAFSNIPVNLDLQPGIPLEAQIGTLSFNPGRNVVSPLTGQQVYDRLYIDGNVYPLLVSPVPDLAQGLQVEYDNTAYFFSLAAGNPIARQISATELLTITPLATGTISGPSRVPNVTPNPLTAPVKMEFLLQPVPEPSTYAMLLVGMGILGWASRRRRDPSAITG